MSVVICKIPKGGLGNQLFPIVNAFVFAHLNQLPVIVVGYHRPKIGPYLRGEKSKRRYKGYFTFQKTIWGECLDRWRIIWWYKKYQPHHEPPLMKLPKIKGKMFIFQQMTSYHDYFGHLKNHRSLVMDVLQTIINPVIIKKWKEASKPVIGVHIRMGDFRKLAVNEAYNGGHVRIPEKYYVDTISAIRKIHGSDLEVSVFTDGFKEEFTQLLDMHNISLVQGNPDILDLLLLSHSKILITTHGSTFSAWAGFLSEAIIILYFNYPKPLRQDNFYRNLYEGTFDEYDPLLLENIQSI